MIVDEFYMIYFKDGSYCCAEGLPVISGENVIIHLVSGEILTYLREQIAGHKITSAETRKKLRDFEAALNAEGAYE